ncbi:MAG TPA: YwqG family protein [Ktedonobacterales bacterium]
MDIGPLTSALNANGLSAYASLADNLALPALRLIAGFAPYATIKLGSSRIGGLPDLPAGQAWPAMNGAPMSFIGQIRLEEVHGLDGADAFPAAGLLSFFYDGSQQTYGSDPNDRAGFSVIYTSDVEQAGLAHQADYPAALPSSARFGSAAVTFEAIPTYAQDLKAEFPDHQVSPQDQQHFEAALAQVAAAPSMTPRHQLLGHPDTIQDDMRQQCQFAANGLADPSSDLQKAAALAASANEWRLLLQIDSDQRLGMTWGSAGMLYFWIRQQDLSNANFNACWVVLQSD